MTYQRTYRLNDPITYTYTHHNSSKSKFIRHKKGIFVAYTPHRGKDTVQLLIDGNSAFTYTKLENIKPRSEDETSQTVSQ